MNLGYILLVDVLSQLAAAVVVRIEQGQLRGEQKWSITGDKSIYSFKGIPYAASPVGELRFKVVGPDATVLPSHVEHFRRPSFNVPFCYRYCGSALSVYNGTSFSPVRALNSARSVLRNIPYVIQQDNSHLNYFKAPQPAPAWSGIRNALEHGNVCPQFDVLRNELVPGSEDCLFLNVYTPSLDKESRLPVLFVIHGGAFVWGSGNDDIYGADFLLNEKDIVVVTFNYRLDNLGFLCLDTAEVPGNAAMKDQVAALRWVQRNIQTFGGEPNNVTMFGGSAGAMSCMYHALSPMSRGLFHRIIAMSGEALNDYTNAFEPHRRPFALAKSLGSEPANATEALEFLQSVPPTDLIHNPNANTVLTVEQHATLKFLYSVPVIEKDFGQERFLTEPYEISLRKGLGEIDILMGFTSEEGVFFIPVLETTPTLVYHDRYPEALVPLSVSRHNTPKRNLEIADSIKEHYTGSKTRSLNTIPLFVPLLTDSFIYPIIRYANIISQYSPSSTIYLYENNLMSERNQRREAGDMYGLTGMAHFDDLQYIFQSNLYHSWTDKTAPSYKMIRTWCTVVTNFMIHGNPTPDKSLGVIWPPYTRETKQYLYIGEELCVCKNPRQSTVDFYDTIYPQV